ncbi:MAG: response regulator [Candidatus Omnitrophota bacterium]
MGKKILIIDDSEQDRKIMARFLKKAGYEDLIMAETGEEGVEKSKTESPDLVVSDTVLPGIDGFEVCRKIREAQGEETPRIIIVTGAIDAVNAVKARMLGANDYCAKTSDCVPLLDAIGKLI